MVRQWYVMVEEEGWHPVQEYGPYPSKEEAMNVLVSLEASNLPSSEGSGSRRWVGYTEGMWALVDCNTSIPGADAAPIAWFESEDEARAAVSNTGQWVELLPVEAQYRSEISGEWV